jgi:hypothetical protein
MASINYAIREISVKIVFYGPGLSGKTTNLQVIHRKIPIDYRSDMVSLATETDRTLFFDFLPLDLGKIKGFSTKFQLYTVPGQVYYNATRKLVLRGVDGVVFVADSAQDKMQENLESFQNLHDNLAEYGIKQGSIPIVIQYNKRDLPNALPVETIDKTINKFGYPWNEAVANQGKGVFESLKIIGKIVIDSLNRKYSRPSLGQSQEPLHRPPAQVSQPQPAQRRPQAEPTFVAPPVRPQQPAAQVLPQRPAPSTQRHQEDIFQSSQQPLRPIAPPAAPKPQPARDDYYDYGSINLEPMAQPAPAPQAPQQQESAVDKTELDLEIEKYQKEIEDKQRRLRSLQSTSQAPQQQESPAPLRPQPAQTQNAFAGPQKANYDVYDLPETDDQIPQFPPRQSEDSQEPPASPDEEQPLYFTSVNTGQRKKIKRPVNPKTKQQGSFLSKFFNKEKPQ